MTEKPLDEILEGENIEKQINRDEIIKRLEEIYSSWGMQSINDITETLAAIKTYETLYSQNQIDDSEQTIEFIQKWIKEFSKVRKYNWSHDRKPDLNEIESIIQSVLKYYSEFSWDSREKYFELYTKKIKKLRKKHSKNIFQEYFGDPTSVMGNIHPTNYYPDSSYIENL